MPAAIAARSSSSRLPTPLKTMRSLRETGRERPGHFALGNDVGPGAKVAKHPQHAEIAVRLHRKADAVRHRRERLVQLPELPPDDIGVVDVGRRAELARHLAPATRRQRAACPRAAPAPRPRAGAPGPARSQRLARRHRQYALAHTTSATAGRPVHMHFVGASEERNSASGMTRIVAFVCSLISASTAGSPHQPAYTKPPPFSR